MGQVRFQIPDDPRFGERALSTICMFGIDGVPWPLRLERKDDELIIERHTGESGRLLISIPFARHGEIGLTTATLPESPHPYRLELEIARGTVGRLRQQMSIWQEGGLVVGAQTVRDCDDIVDRLGEALFKYQNDLSSARQICLATIDSAVDLIFRLAGIFASQVIQLRREHDGAVGTMLGSAAPWASESWQPAEQYPRHFGIVAIPTRTCQSDFQPADPNWDPLETTISAFAERQKQQLLGPLLDFGMPKLPDWIIQAGDFQLQRQAVIQVARQFAGRFGVPRKLIYVAAGLNGIGHPQLSYPQQMQLTLDMLETIEQTRSDIPTVISLDQPWGERLSRSVGGTHAMYITDTLLRHSVQLAALGLEFNVDYWPSGTLARDPFQWVDLVDRWAQFGLPLVIFLCLPFADPRNSSGRSSSKGRPAVRGSFDLSQRLRYLETLVPLLLSRPMIHAVVWRYWADEPMALHRGGGLIDDQGNAKPVLQTLEEIAARTFV